MNWTRKQSLKRDLDAALKILLFSFALVERYQPFHIHRFIEASIGSSGECRQNAACARLFLRRAPGPAHENPSAARRIAGASRVEGAGDRKRIHVGVA